VITFPLDALEAMDPLAGLKRAKRIAAHTSFFKSGICVGRTFVCVVKTSPLSSTIKIFEPIDQNVRGRNKPTFRKLLQGGNDTADIQGVLYPSAVELDTFLAHEASRCVCQWIRDYRSGYARTRRDCLILAMNRLIL
jgi:hypothetical protein